MITTHVLDTSKGGPAVGMTVILEMRQATEWVPVNRGVTDEKGRLSTLTEHWTVSPGTYRLVFDVGDYHKWNGIAAPFFPEVKVTFNVRDPTEYYHVPLLISPYGYSTYRGA